MQIKEVLCRTSLSQSRLPGLVYTLNPYRGCLHSCIYCYVPSVTKEKRVWGGFVDVRINIPVILENEIRKKKKGIVGISTVTDPYQEIERKYELTRKCLTILLKYGFPISIQTKSSLAVRDISLIKKFSEKDIGFTITTLDDKMKHVVEPFAPSIDEIFSAIEKFIDNEIPVWVFIGPVIPFVSDINIHEFIKRIYFAGVKNVIIDKLRVKDTNAETLRLFFAKRFKVKLNTRRELQILCQNRYQKAKLQIFNECKKYGIVCEEAF